MFACVSGLSILCCSSLFPYPVRTHIPGIMFGCVWIVHTVLLLPFSLTFTYEHILKNVGLCLWIVHTILLLPFSLTFTYEHILKNVGLCLWIVHTYLPLQFSLTFIYEHTLKNVGLCLWIVHSYLPLQFSLTFTYEHILMNVHQESIRWRENILLCYFVNLTYFYPDI